MTGLCHLLDLCLNENTIGKRGCTALATLLTNSVSSLYYLALELNEIDDECIDILLVALV